MPPSLRPPPSIFFAPTGADYPRPPAGQFVTEWLPTFLRSGDRLPASGGGRSSRRIRRPGNWRLAAASQGSVSGARTPGGPSDDGTNRRQRGVADDTAAALRDADAPKGLGRGPERWRQPPAGQVRRKSSSDRLWMGLPAGFRDPDRLQDAGEWIVDCDTDVESARAAAENRPAGRWSGTEFLCKSSSADCGMPFRDSSERAPSISLRTTEGTSGERRFLHGQVII